MLTVLFVELGASQQETDKKDQNWINLKSEQSDHEETGA